ncbi:glycoside hydrolase family 78 protein [Mucilaginibacter sp. PAMB04168]|uniref:glycoside hydrolase family 78 protein n=1 Tax=Mucilaginibacter sp. PAMB04168 TaxID=3138567 RepID=UPI0031F71063
MMLLLLSTVAFSKALTVNSLLCEYQVNPVGIDILKPRFSWKLKSTLRNVLQTAYELRVSTNAGDIQTGKQLLYTSGKVNSEQSVFVSYKGPQLLSRMRYYWQVRVWDNQGNASPWSEVNFWEMGLLNPREWTAQWIKTNNLADTTDGASPMFRKAFDLSKPVKTARLYITSHGIYEAFINGQRVGNEYFTPGWTSYNKRLQYQVYDVASLLKSGGNAAGAVLGDGWFRGHLDKWKNLYGKDLSLLMQLEITFTDGSKTTIGTNNDWKTSDGAIRSSSFYNGEIYDGRLVKSGWNTSAYNDEGWQEATVIDSSKSNLIAPVIPGVKKREIFRPLKTFVTPKGDTVIDFGQNLVGWVVLKIKGKKGDVITLNHAEVLDKENNFYTLNLRHAKCVVKYILKGDAEEVYEPHFTYQGFRYVKVSGYKGRLDSSMNIHAVALYSDMNTTGNLTTSNPLLNQLQHNIEWGQKGNFVDVPTDCPQRDERLGWTGDAQAFGSTAAFNMNVSGFFSKWLKDLSADQRADGAVPWVIPNMMPKTSAGVAGWSDVATILPWTMYTTYGDTRMLEEQYPSMKAWVNYMRDQSKDNLWNTGFHFGDWCFYTPSPTDDSGKGAVTDKYLIAQTFYAHSTQLLINAAAVLGKEDDVKSYTELLNQIKLAFQKEYVTASGRVLSSTQTAYLLTLAFDMLPEPQRVPLAKRLVQNIKDYGNHLTTGFLGTPYICPVLTRFGYDDIAYTLLLQDTYPSWLYPVKKGATTIWERWDGIKANGDLQDPSMNSFNHYSYGAIGNWMYHTMAGLNTDESMVGYKKILIAPHPGGKISMVDAALETSYGYANSKWEVSSGIFKMDITVPPNTTAKVVLPGAARKGITESGKSINTVKAISGLQQDNTDVQFQVGSGTYHFQYPYSN